MTDVIIEYNENGVQVFAEDYPGAYARGETKEEALQKLPHALADYRAWSGQGTTEPAVPFRILEEVKSTAFVEEGDTNILFASERLPMDMTEYTQKKALCIRSARDLAALFASVPQKDRALVKSRKTFYGRIPQTSREMYRHVDEMVRRYAESAGIVFEPGADLVESRMRLFAALEAGPHFLEAHVRTAPDGELWTNKKLLRRILWHDRIHAHAMYRKAITFWQKERIENPFRFTGK